MRKGRVVFWWPRQTVIPGEAHGAAGRRKSWASGAEAALHPEGRDSQVLAAGLLGGPIKVTLFFLGQILNKLKGEAKELES